MKLLKYALIVLFSAGMMSCGGSSGGEDLDSEAPKVEITKPVLNPTTVVEAGKDLDVSFKATDNIELKSYTLTINYSGSKSVKQVEEFSFNSNSDKDADGKDLPEISGKEKTVSFKIAIADDAKAGLYKMIVTVKDASGNTKPNEVVFEIKR
ncbi:MAG: DUF4625 domain-containing protein [Marinifilum sp.]|jgi:uncharacterized membrane protein|nr:DUF4625 domain-containing protein [Marinifilum sp.]